MDSTTVTNLKERALACLGEYAYTADGSDVPSARIDSLYEPALREFLSSHQWRWAARVASTSPSNPLVVYESSGGVKPYVYVPYGIIGVPDERPLAQQAFCYLLAMRLAPTLGRLDLLSTLAQQYRMALSEAMYPDAWEMCNTGTASLSTAYDIIRVTAEDARSQVISEIYRLGNTADLNHIDISGLTSFLVYDADTDSYKGLFQGLEFYGDISTWDTSNITDFSYLFYNAKIGNVDLSQWDVSKGTTMRCMFTFSDFNGDITTWNTASLQDMAFMFAECGSFNQDLSLWDTSNVTSLSASFRNAVAFNGNVTTWDTSSCTDMTNTFQGCISFNQDISGWNVSNVVNLNGFLLDATIFNQNLSAWVFTSLLSCYDMLSGTSYSFSISALQTTMVNVTYGYSDIKQY